MSVIVLNFSHKSRISKCGNFLRISGNNSLLTLKFGSATGYVRGVIFRITYSRNLVFNTRKDLMLRIIYSHFTTCSICLFEITLKYWSTGFRSRRKHAPNPVQIRHLPWRLSILYPRRNPSNWSGTVQYKRWIMRTRQHPCTIIPNLLNKCWKGLLLIIYIDSSPGRVFDQLFKDSTHFASACLFIQMYEEVVLGGARVCVRISIFAPFVLTR